MTIPSKSIQQILGESSSDDSDSEINHTEAVTEGPTADADAGTGTGVSTTERTTLTGDDNRTENQEEMEEGQNTTKNETSSEMVNSNNETIEEQQTNEEKEGEGNEIENANENDTSNKNHESLFHSDDDSDEEEDVEFQDDDIIGKSAPKNNSRNQINNNNNNNTNNRNQKNPAHHRSLLPPRNEDEEEEYNHSNLNNLNFGDNNNNLDNNPSSTKKQKKAPLNVPPRTMTVLDMPHPKRMLKTDNISYHITTFPKIVAINTDPYNAGSHDAGVEDELYRGRIHNMIRWRYVMENKNNDGHNHNNDPKEQDQEGFSLARDDNGKLKRESNAKMVKWSDGTWGLVVGKEVFDMDEFGSLDKNKDKKNKITTAAAPPTAPTAPTTTNNNNKLNNSTNAHSTKEFLYLIQKAESFTPTEESKPAGTVLECYAPLSSKFIPRPASLQSSAHRNFVLAERNRNLKRSKIAEVVTFMDPEKEKAERIRHNEDLSKQERRGAAGGRRSTAGSNRSRFTNRRSKYNDYYNDDGYDNYGIEKIKKDTLYDDDEDAYDMNYGEEEGIDEWTKGKRRNFDRSRESGNTRSRRPFDSDEEDDNRGSKRSANNMQDMSSDNESYYNEEDDDELEEINRKKKARKEKKTSSATFFDDDDESESE